MASKKRKHSETEGSPKQRLLPKSMHFFKIILQDTLLSGKLVFPKRFIKMYGENLSNVVCLRVPTGDVWEMELQRCSKGSVWLEKGWRDFASFYSLEFGHFLVFKYVQELEISEFQVVIFDQSTLEIESIPIKIEPSDDYDENDASMSSLPSKRLKNCTSYKNSNVHRHLKPPTEKVEALLRSKSFRSNNPYFARIMQPSYVHRPYILSVPSKFLQRYISKENAGQVKLHISNGQNKTWPIRYCRGDHGANLYRGWMAFVEENKLVVDDVCVFELMRDTKSKQVLFNVTIFRAPHSVKFCDDAGTSQPDSELVSKNPFFQVVIRRGYLSHKTLSVPWSFVKSNLNSKCEEQILTLESDGGWSWQVKLHNYPQSFKAKLCGGFSAFLRDNDLEVGDLCTFELIDREQMVFLVSICRGGR